MCHDWMVEGDAGTGASEVRGWWDAGWEYIAGVGNGRIAGVCPLMLEDLYYYTFYTNVSK